MTFLKEKDRKNPDWGRLIDVGWGTPNFFAISRAGNVIHLKNMYFLENWQCRDKNQWWFSSSVQQAMLELSLDVKWNNKSLIQCRMRRIRKELHYDAWMQLFELHGCPCCIRTELKAFWLQTLTASPVTSAAAARRSKERVDEMRSSTKYGNIKSSWC